MSAGTEQGVRIEHRMGSEEYHSHPAIGSSMLRDFIESPRLYEGLHVASPPTVKKASTPAMDFGTVLHTAVLCDQPLNEVMVEIPSEVLTRDGKRAGAKWEEWSEKNAGKIQLRREEFECVIAARDAVRNNPFARQILNSDGPSEQSIFWHDTSGLQCKARLDKATGVFGANWIADVKTSSDPRPDKWAKSAMDFGYHIQKAHYIAAFEAAYGERPPFVFIVVSNKAPFVCRVYDLDSAATDLGEIQRRNALDDLAARVASGDWSELHEREITELSFPRWVFAKE